MYPFSLKNCDGTVRYGTSTGTNLTSYIPYWSLQLTHTVEQKSHTISIVWHHSATKVRRLLKVREKIHEPLIFLKYSLCYLIVL